VLANVISANITEKDTNQVQLYKQILFAY